MSQSNREQKYQIAVFAVLALLTIILFGCKLHFSKSSQKYSAIVRLYQAGGFCTGTVISKTLVLTAAHCTNPLSQFKVLSTNGAGQTTAIVYAANGQSDLALLYGDFSAFESMQVETDTETIIAAYEKHPIAICGYPQAGDLYCNAFAYLGPYIFGMLGKAHLYPGMSGGPVIDVKTGKVIGVNTAVTDSNSIVSPVISLFQQFGLPAA